MVEREVVKALALSSTRQLRSYIRKLTDEELHECLEKEYASSRRKSVIDTIVATLAERNRQTFITNLKEKYNGTRQFRGSEQG